MLSIRSLAATAGAVAVLAAAPLGAFAQMPAPITQTQTATKTGTITSIDYSGRTVDLQFPDGTAATVSAGPNVTRFAALKIGDTVTFTETQSVVYSIAKPGTTAPADTHSMALAPGAKPGAAASETLTTVVTIQAIDASIPSVTVMTADGRTLAFLVQNPQDLTGVKVGDKVQVAYTQSVMITVK